MSAISKIHLQLAESPPLGGHIAEEKSLASIPFSPLVTSEEIRHSEILRQFIELQKQIADLPLYCGKSSNHELRFAIIRRIRNFIQIESVWQRHSTSPKDSKLYPHGVEWNQAITNARLQDMVSSLRKIVRDVEPSPSPTSWTPEEEDLY